MHLLSKILKQIMSRGNSTPGNSTPSDQFVQLDPQIKMVFQKVLQEFGNSQDLVTECCDAGMPGGKCEIGLIYIRGLVDDEVIREHIKAPFQQAGIEQLGGFADHSLEIVKGIVSAAGEAKSVADYDSLFDAILSGETVILMPRQAVGLSVNTRGSKRRGVEEPSTQSVVRGPREGFTEMLDINIALIRARIKSPQLWLENRIVGRLTRTDIGIMYIKGIVNEKIIQEVRTRLDRIDIDGILEGSNIEELIQDETLTPFPTIFHSERPDAIAAGLLEGRIAILVDGTPFVLLVPALFIEFFQSSEDYYQRADFATLIRMLRYVCFFISLLAPSLYIAVTTFHQELLPSPLLFSLASQREGIPFPALVEALVMEITFEILREAGVRLPKSVGQAVSIVGALVIGQAAVEAGLVSPAMVIIVSITAIANFVIPSFNMGISIRIIRFLMMLVAAAFGLFGVTIGMVVLVQHLCSLRSFGVPYMSPMSPFVLEDQKDTILRLPQWRLNSRPHFISQKNVIRKRPPFPAKQNGTKP